jgi:hypothetical protein
MFSAGRNCWSPREEKIHTGKNRKQIRKNLIYIYILLCFPHFFCCAGLISTSKEIIGCDVYWSLSTDFVLVRGNCWIRYSVSATPTSAKCRCALVNCRCRIIWSPKITTPGDRYLRIRLKKCMSLVEMKWNGQTQARINKPYSGLHLHSIYSLQNMCPNDDAWETISQPQKQGEG